MKPDNYVEPPDLSKLVPLFPPANPSPFWTEFGKTIAWLRYQWAGPSPKIAVNLRTVYPDFQFSSQAIYQSIMDEIGRKQIPSVEYERTVLHESGPFSPYRTYLRIRREFSEYFICAAPVGTSYFISVRNVDRFPHSRWFHYLLVGVLLWLLFLLGVRWNGLVGGIVVVALSLSLVWSLFRYAAYAKENLLSEHLPHIPVVGALFLRWFRPDTFYREDIHAAFVTLVDGIIKRVVASIEPAPPMRADPESLGGPIRTNLGRDR